MINDQGNIAIRVIPSRKGIVWLYSEVNVSGPEDLQCRRPIIYLCQDKEHHFCLLSPPAKTGGAYRTSVRLIIVEIFKSRFSCIGRPAMVCCCGSEPRSNFHRQSKLFPSHFDRRKSVTCQESSWSGPWKPEKQRKTNSFHKNFRCHQSPQT